eukprot:NODE_17290_length_951_cov_3.879854.p5 GENE.NODE_17290_length_951_cov_3.879854~~NODE_17290_length_951_cov_3.879854.p5  ORF type:complete len:84 (-),score=14.87 NODE_17290_length_951_cov_3.879854:314-565(-)
MAASARQREPSASQEYAATGPERKYTGDVDKCAGTLAEPGGALVLLTLVHCGVSPSPSFSSRRAVRRLSVAPRHRAEKLSQAL